jgi:hypothetical protein
MHQARTSELQKFLRTSAFEHGAFRQLRDSGARLVHSHRTRVSATVQQALTSITRPYGVPSQIGTPR